MTARKREIDGSIKPAIPYLELYDSSTNSEIPSIPWQWYSVVWNYYGIVTSDFIVKYDAVIPVTIVVIQTTGLYRIDMQLHIHNETWGASCMSHLLLNGIEVPYSISYLYIGYGLDNTLSSTITLYLRKKDTVTCEWATDTVQDVSLGENSVFRISYIPMLGWNNNQAGVPVNRGVRR